MQCSHRLTASLLALLIVIPPAVADLTSMNPDEIPSQLQHPLKMLATTAMSGEGRDYFSLKPGQSATVGTITGPAIIFRIWSTSSNTKHTALTMIVDGKSEALVQKGQLPPGVTQPDPLRGLDMQAYWSYVPVFVQKQAVFVARSYVADKTAEPIRFYLQAGYRNVSGPELAEARKLSLPTVREWISHLGQAAHDNPAGAHQLTGEVSVKTPWEPPLSGPSLITELQLGPVGNPAGGITPEQCQDTRLIIECDGQRTVDAPLSALFAAWNKVAMDSAAIQAQADRLTLRLPMPVASSMKLSLARFGRRPISQMSASATILKLPQAPEYRLCAQYFSQLSIDDKPMTWLNVTGEGIFLGTNMTANGLQRKTFAFLEGNEQIYVDGDTEPTIEGTGTEDYFNGAWYFEAGETAHPFHGVTFKQDREPPVVDCYRHLVSDCIPFKQSLRFDMQHGSRNKAPDVLYEGVNFWYQTLPVSVAEPVRVAIPRDQLPEGMEPTGHTGGRPLPWIVFHVLVGIVAGLLALVWRKKRGSASRRHTRAGQ